MTTRVPVRVGNVVHAELHASLHHTRLSPSLRDAGSNAAIVFDTQSRSARLEVPAQEGSATITQWRPDGAGGDALVAFSPSQVFRSDHRLFRAVDGTDGSTVLELFNDKPGAYSAVALGRLGAASASLVFGASGADRLAGGAWTQIAMSTGAGQWESPPAADIDDAFDMQPRAALILDEGTPTSRLVLAGTSDFRGAHLVSLDGATHAIQWARDHTTIPSLEDRGVADVKEVRLDGSRSLVACLDSGQGPRLMMMDAQTGAPQWESTGMGGFEGCRHAIAGRFNDGPDPFVVAVLATSLRAFNANTHLPEWVLTTPAAGASLLQNGENGREIVVFHGADLRFYDAASRTLLREFALEDPVTAVTPLGTDIHQRLWHRPRARQPPRRLRFGRQHVPDWCRQRSRRVAPARHAAKGSSRTGSRLAATEHLVGASMQRYARLGRTLGVPVAGDRTRI